MPREITVMERSAGEILDEFGETSNLSNIASRVRWTAMEGILSTPAHALAHLPRTMVWTYCTA